MTGKQIFLKTIGYRIFSTIATSVISYLLTGDILVSVTIGLWDSIFKFGVYYAFEYFVNRIINPKIDPAVVWMTGLSGAGKTTIAHEMKHILDKWGNKVVVLDGDEIRNMFSSTGFDEESRKAHNKRVAYMAKLLKDQGSIVIVSLISPYAESRSDARKMIGARFFETYVSTDIATCEGRDVKGLYRKVRAGEIKNFTGVDSPFEAPEFPDIEIGTSDMTVRECAIKIINQLR